LYGPPGTGKTEYSRTLAKNLLKTIKSEQQEKHQSTFEINAVDGDGDAISGTERMKAYSLCQEVNSNNKGIVIFDEIEDVFPANLGILFGRREGPNKGWINSILENNPLPSIWISNAIWQIDPAYLRRFDYVIELDTPPKFVRKNILEETLGKSQHSVWIERVAGHASVTPALLQTALKVANHSKCKGKKAEEVMEKVMNSHLEMQGESKIKPSKKGKHLAYDVELLNTNEPMNNLTQGLHRAAEGRVCLYGPPGTGKTAYARYVADQIGSPLLAKKSSDLLGMYVGETEKNIANLFRQAKKEKAIVLIDEADSFLRDRSRANHSWEITQINEFLVQMELYEGILFCSTNLFDQLDPATLRRFDFKVGFDYLLPDKSKKLFVQLLKESGLKPKVLEQEESFKLVSSLTNLTPGDFAVIKRKQFISNQTWSPMQMAQNLVEESRVKENKNIQKIGFL
ncbi:MAG: ATP-binding protein, partial [SAR324 cluster bacterium]|nr:ATP-binding protein [SAR324 cluster bacterium]